MDSIEIMNNIDQIWKLVQEKVVKNASDITLSMLWWLLGMKFMANIKVEVLDMCMLWNDVLIA